MRIQQFDENGVDIADSTTNEHGNATVRSLNIIGLDVQPVEIEIDISPGLPYFIIVGLPDAAVAEARDRVRTAIKNSGYRFPRNRVTVNLAPSHLRKVGSLFDLPIAIGVLIASGQLQVIEESTEWCSVGELSLHGSIRSINGALPLAHYACTQYSTKKMIVPSENTTELAAFTESNTVFTANTLQAVAKEFSGANELPGLHTTTAKKQETFPVLLEDIIGQEHAKRALIIAAAGGHNLLLRGTPGVGKSMLAQALPSILPPLSSQELLETHMIHSIAGYGEELQSTRPFRAPHHSSSTVSIVGGGNQLRPGEISLAHNGVLFLDELPEFKRSVLETLRQPLENGSIQINRAHGSATYPARCILVAAMNPCPCGYANADVAHTPECSCTAYAIQRYQQKLSGPVLDRIDMKVHTQYITPEQIEHGQNKKIQQENTSAHLRKCTQQAYSLQIQRQGCSNAYLSGKEIRTQLQLDVDSSLLLNNAMKLGLSMRGYIKTLRVARTIADLEERSAVTYTDIAEALSYTR